MSRENPKWGASRIHGELLMLGFEVAQSTVSKYMVRGGSPSQGWKTFFRNHAQAIAAIDLFVVPPNQASFLHSQDPEWTLRNFVTAWEASTRWARLQLQPGLDSPKQPEAHLAVIARERDYETHPPVA